MSGRAAAIGALLGGVAVTAVYHVFEALEPRNDVWFAGLVAGFGLVALPILISLATVEIVGRFAGVEHRLPRVRAVMLAGGGLVGVGMMSAISLNASDNPFIGVAFVLLPLIVFALGLAVLGYVVVMAFVDHRRGTLGS